MYTLLHNKIDNPIIYKNLTTVEVEYMLLFGPVKPNPWYCSKPNIVDFIIQSNIALYAIKSRGIDRLSENKKALTIYGLRIRGPIIIYVQMEDINTPPKPPITGASLFSSIIASNLTYHVEHLCDHIDCTNFSNTILKHVEVDNICSHVDCKKITMNLIKHMKCELVNLVLSVLFIIIVVNICVFRFHHIDSPQY